MGKVGAYQAKTHLSELLDRVETGERITITRNEHCLGPDLSIRDLIREGRKR